PAPIEMLPLIRKAVGPDFPLFYDSGIRSGEDVLRALHAGADFVFLGRILQFAMAAAGEPGLERLWDLISDEMSIAMAQTGMSSLRIDKNR
ncbi:MAG: alpha-hydroxy-acid oxidizing protein, partial [Roseobacter sp.]